MFGYDDSMEIKGKTVLVTGGAKRVGREIALMFAKHGTHIFLHYHQSQIDAEKTALDIKAFGVRCTLFKANLGQTVEIQKMLKELPWTPDILINSASLFYRTPIEEITEMDWDQFFNVNLKAPFLLSQSIGSKMSRENGGKIVNIADWSGFRPYKDYAPYCASKGGLITLTKSLARDLAPKVLANAIAPGPILPPHEFSEEEKEIVAKTTAVGRWGSPADIANAAVFLAENDFINGTVLVVDGGRSIV